MATVIPKQLKNNATRSQSASTAMSLRTGTLLPVSGSARDYVINQCLAFIFRKDKAFQLWLAGDKGGSSADPEGHEATPTNAKAKNGAVQGRVSISE